MAFSFSKWFKKSGPNAEQPDHGQPAASPPPPAAAPAPPAPAQVPAAQLPAARNVKSAMPNSVRPANLHEGTRAFPPGSPSSVSLRNAPPPAPAPPVNRTVSFPGLTAAPAAAPAPAPAPAPAATLPKPPPDAAIALTLGDFVDRIPASLLKAGAPVDRNREVVFQAADLYSDLARGRASVPVSTIQSVCPDLFGRPVTDTEDVEIALPLPKLVEQLGAALQTRSDQVAEEDVGEIETPFLQVALEDSVRLPKPPVSPAPAAPKTVSPVAPSAVVRKPLSSVLPPPAPASSASEAGQAPVRALASRPPSAPAPVGTVPPPPASISAPTAQSVTPIGTGTKRPPSTVRASVAGGKIRLSGPAISSRSIAPVSANAAPAAPLAPTGPAPTRSIPAPAISPSAASAPAQKKTARIQIPPIALRSGAGPGGNGVPAAPPPTRPPASGMRPAGPAGKTLPFPEPLVSFRATPNEAPTPGTPAALPPITMPTPRTLPMTVPLAPPAARRLIAPSPFPTAPMFAPPPTAPAEPAAAAVTPDAPPIALALAPILRGQPAALFAEGLDGDTAAGQVPDDARVHFPLPFITSQLAQGRVNVPRAMFAAAMPEALRHLVSAEGEPAEVTIPLQEVFQNLPMGALTHRHDQVTEEVGPEIPTPFSMKAEEDAQRLRAAAPPAPEPEPQPEAVLAPVEEPAAELPPVVEAESQAEPSLQADAPAEPMVEPAPEALAAEPAAEAEASLLVETPEAETAPEPVAMETPVIEPEPTAETLPDAPLQEAEPLPAFTLEPTVNAADEPAAPLETPHPEFAALAGEAQAPAEPAHRETPAHLEMPVDEAPAPEPALAAETQPDRPSAEAASEFTPPVKAPPQMARVHLPPLEPPAREIAPTVHSNDVNPVEPMPAPVVTHSAEEVQDALRAIFMVEDDLDAKKIVKLVGQMPGLKACAIMFGDGLKLAGELDGIPNGEGFSAMTPAFFRRVGSYAQELELGAVQHVTLQTDRALLSFFMHGDVCLSIQHAGSRGFLPGVREKLLATTHELAQMYATPAPGR